MQTRLSLNRPAINVYFDDISLTKPTILPVSLLSFKGNEVQGTIHLNWTINPDLQLKQFELEQSSDATYFNSIATFQAGKTSYQFIDDNNSHSSGRHFYRLKTTDTDGKNAYSNIITIKTSTHEFINLCPNPANKTVAVNGSFQKGIISVIDSNGRTVLTANANTSPVKMNLSLLPAGLYTVRFSDPTTVINKKLVIQPK